MNLKSDEFLNCFMTNNGRGILSVKSNSEHSHHRVALDLYLKLSELKYVEKTRSFVFGHCIVAVKEKEVSERFSFMIVYFLMYLNLRFPV